MGYTIINNIDKGWFRLDKINKGGEYLEYLLNKHNIDLEDYNVLKCSNKFRFIDKEDIDKWAGVICFRKDIHNREHLSIWLDLINNKLKVDCRFLHKPFPPKEIFNKIKIVGKE